MLLRISLPLSTLLRESSALRIGRNLKSHLIPIPTPFSNLLANEWNVAGENARKTCDGTGGLRMLCPLQEGRRLKEAKEIKCGRRLSENEINPVCKV